MLARQVPFPKSRNVVTFCRDGSFPDDPLVDFATKDAIEFVKKAMIPLPNLRPSAVEIETDPWLYFPKSVDDVKLSPTLATNSGVKSNYKPPESSNDQDGEDLNEKTIIAPMMSTSLASPLLTEKQDKKPVDSNPSPDWNPYPSSIAHDKTRDTALNAESRRKLVPTTPRSQGSRPIHRDRGEEHHSRPTKHSASDLKHQRSHEDNQSSPMSDKVQTHREISSEQSTAFNKFSGNLQPNGMPLPRRNVESVEDELKYTRDPDGLIQEGNIWDDYMQRNLKKNTANPLLRAKDLQKLQVRSKGLLSIDDSLLE